MMALGPIIIIMWNYIFLQIKGGEDKSGILHLLDIPVFTRYQNQSYRVPFQIRNVININKFHNIQRDSKLEWNNLICTLSG